MSDSEKLMIKCIDALQSMVTILSIAVGEACVEIDGEGYQRAYGKYSAAHYDLIHLEDGDVSK